MEHGTSFGRWLHQRRKALDLTQEELAGQIVCAVDTIRKIEQELRRPSKDIAERLALVLGVSEDERPAFVRFARGEARADQTALPKEPEQPAPWHPQALPPSNLPIPPTPLIGRLHEIASVVAFLERPHVRLLTLTGPGGIGKTRLALQIAAECRDAFSDGVWFVSLAPLTDPQLVASTIAQTLGIKEQSNQPLQVVLQRFLHDRTLILVLDNFEQVVASAPLVSDVLAAAPRLKVLVTSRIPLHVSGEQEFPVPPLGVPDLTHAAASEQLAQYEAVRLFIERARAVNPAFHMNDATGPVVAEICARLDGLPLAIELAAARIKLLTPDALLQRLSSRLALLTGGARDLPARQQTLWHAIDWSYRLLDHDEQTLFARLSVFAGGCTLDAAEAVCNTTDDLLFAVVDGLQFLVDKSLLQATTGRNGEPRFVMLETIREYAQERLRERQEAAAIRRHHAAYFLKLVEHAEPELRASQQGMWLEQLDQELHNLRGAMEWALEQGDIEVLGRMSVALGDLWDQYGYLREGAHWLDAVRSHATVLPLWLRAKTHTWLSWLKFRLGAYAEAVPLVEEGVALGREVDDASFLAFALTVSGNVLLEVGQDAEAERRFQESLVLSRAHGDTLREAESLFHLGLIPLFRFEHDRAVEMLAQAVGMYADIGQTRFVFLTQMIYGAALLVHGDLPQATQLIQQAAPLLHQRLGVYEVYGLLVVAALLTYHGQGRQAVQVFSAADTLRETMGMQIGQSARPLVEHWIGLARAHLDDAAFAAAWVEGQTMPMEQIIALATAVSEQAE